MADIKTDPSLFLSPQAPPLIAAVGYLAEGRRTDTHQYSRGGLFGSTKGLLSVGFKDAEWVVPLIHAVWIPPNHPHSARSHGAFEGWLVSISENRCDDLPKQPKTIRTSGLLLEAVYRAAEWPLGPPPDAPSNRIAEIILDEIRRLPEEPFGLPLPVDTRLMRIARALIEDPASERDLQGWADWAAVSKRTISRRFVDETGFTFTEWRQRVRLLRSLEMLATNTPITTIAFDLGYSSASAFISLFKRTFGETPSAYRGCI
ncbi:AraC family transcriptional regulator [Kineobactrum salinum]|uniref:AraC family transcriptional regulator n=1 Tax=Kineobactrum salinum TaxID=2708301 RepID=A0A6C0TZ52_9GAMM|nr:helix-turn-helix transcriptional regulator [Kineobactrum salinum]QIB65071.1 AraC family transcriptional regulator [Kineobactrum salinum]